MSVRRLVTATSLMVAMLGATMAPAVAATMHPLCAAEDHGCATAAKIAGCCCHDHSDGSAQTTPATRSVQLMPMPTVPATPVPAADARMVPGGIRVPATPRAAPVGLFTLFACLLI